ncbi:MAG: hypothetical protein CSB33_01010 [Desulfobacterales bacterium]|nr:MAG: hypothetical protein CSB33_01010 [Desulfobacterales bacterium]
MQILIVIGITVIAVGYLVYTYTKKSNSPCGCGCASPCAGGPTDKTGCSTVELADNDGTEDQSA